MEELKNIKLTIDGQEIEVPQGTTILDAARKLNIKIPTLCHHPELKPWGGCRMCLVELEGRPNPVVSCATEATEGMKVVASSDKVYELRKEVLSLILSDHPLDCVVCEKNGACVLQDYAYQFDLAESSYSKELGRTHKQEDNPFFVRDHRYCILCDRCVRVCRDVVGAEALTLTGRGFTSRISTPFDAPMAESPCVFCGSCVQVCPVAALTNVSRYGRGRDWDFRKEKTICGYCGVGCGIELVIDKNDKLVEVRGDKGHPVSRGFLCTKGRYGWDIIHHPERLTHPLISKDYADSLGLQGLEDGPKGFYRLTWDQALDIAAGKLAEIVDKNGSQAIGGLASAKCTNEENYLFQKLIRGVLDTNNVDHCARLCHSSSVTALNMALGTSAMTNPVSDIREADCILITGANPSESHPVISYEVTRALGKGASLIVIEPRKTLLARKAQFFLQCYPGTDLAIFQAMAKTIIDEGWIDQEFINNRTEDFEQLRSSLEGKNAEWASEESGVPAELIRDAARHYALGLRKNAETGKRGNSTILYGMGITQFSNGTERVLSLGNLTMMTGQIGKANAGINPLRGQCNVQGSCDVGCLPNVYPGYQPVDDSQIRSKFEGAWGVSLPEKPGMTVVEMMQAAHSKELKALYIMGENPMVSDPNLGKVEQELANLEFILVQDIFLTETAQKAHIVLPAAFFVEKEGTFTNTERRVQPLNKIFKTPEEAKEDWRIISMLGERLSGKLNKKLAWNYSHPSEIMTEMSGLMPAFAGINYERLKKEGSVIWPCPSAEHPGTPRLHLEQFARGLGKFHPVSYDPPVEPVNDEFPLTLVTARSLYHYQTGTMTRRSQPLDWREPRPLLAVSPQDAEKFGVTDGKSVTLESRRGSIKVQAKVNDWVKPGVVFLPFHFREAAANMLTSDNPLDKYSRMPNLKLCAVRVLSKEARTQSGSEKAVIS